MENIDYVKDNDIVDMTILVTKWGAYIADCPDNCDEFLDGIDCDDNRVDSVPEEYGIYKCKAKFWFEQGYDDMGYAAAGESDWGFSIESYEKIY